MKAFCFLILSVLTCRASEKIEIQREGAAWKITITGSLPPQPVTRIAAMGDLTVRGKRSKDIHYTISQKVIAADELSVRRLAEYYRVQAGAIGKLAGGFAFLRPGAVRVEIPRGTSGLAVSSESGMLDIADVDGSLWAGATAGTVTLDRIGGDVEIHSNGGAASLGSIGGTVRCYSGGGTIRAIRIKGSALFQTDGGDIQLGEVLGAVKAFTAAGGIHIDQAGAEVFADTLGGSISILRALGMVVANSDGGPINIGGAASVQCRSASGTIRLSSVSGSLQAFTERGSIVAEILAGRGLSDSFLSTRSGDITVFIPSNMGVTIDAESNGSPNRRPIVSDFSGLEVKGRKASVTARGRVNGGGPRLRLSSDGGRIEIRRK